MQIMLPAQDRNPAPPSVGNVPGADLYLGSVTHKEPKMQQCSGEMAWPFDCDMLHTDLR